MQTFPYPKFFSSDASDGACLVVPTIEPGEATISIDGGTTFTPLENDPDNATKTITLTDSEAIDCAIVRFRDASGDWVAGDWRPLERHAPVPIVSPVTTLSKSQELAYLEMAKQKILEAMAKGAGVVSEIEIRGRIIKHNDLPAELRMVKAEIFKCEGQLSGNRHLRPARTRARLGYGRRC